MRIMAVPGSGADGIIVRTSPNASPPLVRIPGSDKDYDQSPGVHGTIVDGPLVGTAGGFTGNWWKIDWDAGIDGWCAESVLAPVPTAGDILPQPNFTTSSNYTTNDIFWQDGNAPTSTNPPTPQLGGSLGNCTWYAYGRLLELGYSSTQLKALTGSAGQWADEANANKSGMRVDNLPAVGSIAQTGSTPYTGEHVAIVESCNPDGTITVTESAYVTDLSSPWNFLWRNRTVMPSWFQNFIHVSQVTSPTQLYPWITMQPTPPPEGVNVGSGAVLAVGASGSSPLSYQWYFNGSPISNATGTTLSLSNVQLSAAGLYSVDVTDSEGNEVTSTGATLIVNAPVASNIASQPISQTVSSGNTVVFTVTPSGSVQASSRAANFSAMSDQSTTYQWQFNGVNLTDGNGISGSAGPELLLQGVNSTYSGNYSCIVTTGAGSVTSNTAGLVVTTVLNPGLATSISTRAFVGTGDNILIGGFYVVGSTSRTVLIQALGPALGPLGVSDFLARPELSIHQTQNGHDVTLYSNVGWGSSQVLLAAAASVFATPVLSQGSADSELLLTLPPGGYSAEVGGADGGTGVALCAIYELP
jgi:surface antigen